MLIVLQVWDWGDCDEECYIDLILGIVHDCLAVGSTYISRSIQNSIRPDNPHEAWSFLKS